jgi:hypothetical protein
MCNRFRSIEEWSESGATIRHGPPLDRPFNPKLAASELTLEV